MLTVLSEEKRSNECTPLLYSLFLYHVSKERLNMNRKIYRKDKRRKLKYSLVGVTIILLCLFAYSLQDPSNPITNSYTNHFSFKAAIVDHLSLLASNQSFVETATNILEQAGYTVDYYPSENVTVEFYSDLPLYARAYPYKSVLLALPEEAWDYTVPEP